MLAVTSVRVYRNTPNIVVNVAKMVYTQLYTGDYLQLEFGKF